MRTVCYNRTVDRARWIVEETRAVGALDALRGEWDALLERSPSATLYQTWEWNEAWWRCHGRGKRLHLITVRDEGAALVGIAPLYVSLHLGTPMRRLAFVGTGAADYLDIVAAEGLEVQVCAAVLERIAASRCFDMADLQQLRPGSALRTAAGDAAFPEALRARLSAHEQEPCPGLLLADTWDQVAAGLGKKMRTNIGYYERLITRSFDAVEVSIAGEAEIDEGMRALFDLHRARWRSRMMPGVLASARTQAFHTEIARRFHARGALRLHLMRLDGRIASALYCYRFRDRYYYYLGGFDPELGKFSLGTVLTAHAIRQAVAEGCRLFDFLRGAEPYKYRWLPEDVMNERLLLARPRSLRASAMLRLNRLEHHLEMRAKVWAENWGRKVTK